MPGVAPATVRVSAAMQIQQSAAGPSAFPTSGTGVLSGSFSSQSAAEFANNE